MSTKVINKGNPNIELGSLKFKDMEVRQKDTCPPLTQKEFEDLPHVHWEKSAPVRQSFAHSNYFLRFRLPPKNKWMLGRVLDRRIVECWDIDMPPLVSHKDDFVNQFVHEVGHVKPEWAGHFGTQVGSQLMSCALQAASEEMLWQWLIYKEKQRIGGQNVHKPTH